MPYARSKILASAYVEPAKVRCIVPAPRSHSSRSSERHELDTLRAINAHLMRELATLRRREAAALRLADRDGLTGVYSRRCMQELLSAAINEAKAQRQYLGVLFIDLNGFKAVNDEHGHAAGDKVLTTVATRISARVRIGDIVCRYGGDEFVVVLPNLPDARALARIADTLREHVALPFWVGGEELHLSAAIGESLYPHEGDCGEALLQRADQAMYKRKLSYRRDAAGAAPVCAPQPRLARRRNDRAKPPHDGAG